MSKRPWYDKPLKKTPSPQKVRNDLLREVGERTRRILANQGSDESVDDVKWREVHMEDHWIYMDDRGQVSIKTGFVKAVLVYTQCRPEKTGHSDFTNRELRDLLEMMRRNMILDDLANV